MSALLKAELLRLASRRLMVVMLVGMVALAASAALVGAESVGPPSEQEIAWAEESLEEETVQWQEACGGETVSSECEGWPKPVPAAFEWWNASFGEYAEGALEFGLPLLLVAVAVMVASLIGAEFASGNMGSQLVFTPRRIPVMIAKMSAGCVAGVLLAATFVGASLALSAITFLSLRGAHDMSAGIGLPLWMGRIMVLALILAVMSGALAMGLGSTLATMGVFAVVFLGSLMLEPVTPGDSWLHLVLPSSILQTMMAGSYEVYDWRSTATVMLGPDGSLLPSQIINYDWAFGYSVIGTGIIVVAAAWSFLRRDILR